MIASMDLNASPLPEDDEETYERHIEHYSAPEEHVESAVEISRRVLLEFSLLAFFCFILLPFKECI